MKNKRSNEWPKLDLMPHSIVFFVSFILGLFPPSYNLHIPLHLPCSHIHIQTRTWYQHGYQILRNFTTLNIICQDITKLKSKSQNITLIITKFDIMESLQVLFKVIFKVDIQIFRISSQHCFALCPWKRTLKNAHDIKN